MDKLYVIDSIRSKTGLLREIHNELIGRKCYIISIKKNERGWLAFKPIKEDGLGVSGFHRLRTSNIIDCVYYEDGSIEFETDNTFYHLRPYYPMP